MASCGIEPEDKGPFVLSVSWTLFALASIAVMLRIAGRVLPQISTGPLGWDDGTITVTLLVMLVLQMFVMKGADIALGKDIWILAPPIITEGLKVSEFRVC